MCVCVYLCLCGGVCVKDLLIYSFAHSVSVREGTPVKELKRERRSPEGLAVLFLSSVFVTLSLPPYLSLSVSLYLSPSLPLSLSLPLSPSLPSFLPCYLSPARFSHCFAFFPLFQIGRAS